MPCSNQVFCHNSDSSLKQNSTNEKPVEKLDHQANMLSRKTLWQRQLGNTKRSKVVQPQDTNSHCQKAKRKSIEKRRTYHLALLSTLLNLRNQFLLLRLKRSSLPLYFPNRFIQHSLVLPQQFWNHKSHTNAYITISAPKTLTLTKKQYYLPEQHICEPQNSNYQLRISIQQIINQRNH